MFGWDIGLFLLRPAKVIGDPSGYFGQDVLLADFSGRCGITILIQSGTTQFLAWISGIFLKCLYWDILDTSHLHLNCLPCIILLLGFSALKFGNTIFMINIHSLVNHFGDLLLNRSWKK